MEEKWRVWSLESGDSCGVGGRWHQRKLLDSGLILEPYIPGNHHRQQNYKLTSVQNPSLGI